MTQYRYPIDMTGLRMRHLLAFTRAGDGAEGLAGLIAAMSDLTGIDAADMQPLDFYQLMEEAAEQISAYLAPHTQRSIRFDLPEEFRRVLEEMDDEEDAP